MAGMACWVETFSRMLLYSSRAPGWPGTSIGNSLCSGTRRRFPMLWPRRLFWFAGFYGLVVVLPQYFLEDRVGRDYPPATTHPEYFSGFIGVALAWQVAFLIIAMAPARSRPLIIPAVIEK